MSFFGQNTNWLILEERKFELFDIEISSFAKTFVCILFLNVDGWQVAVIGAGSRLVEKQAGPSGQTQPTPRTLNNLDPCSSFSINKESDCPSFFQPTHCQPSNWEDFLLIKHALSGLDNNISSHWSKPPEKHLSIGQSWRKRFTRISGWEQRSDF